MQHLTKLLLSLSVTFLVGFLFANPATASAFTLSGAVKDNLGNAIPDASVDIIESSTQSTIQSTATSAQGSYSTNVSEGTYNIQVTPPSASGFQSAIALMQHVTGDTVVNFVLVNSSTVVTLSGRVLDATGNGVPNQCVNLNTDTGAVATDDSGFYSISVVPGSYPIRLQPCGGEHNMIPQNYTISTASTISLTQDTTLEIQLPLKHVIVRVQDLNGLPVAGAAIGTDNPIISTLTIGGLSAFGSSYYGQAGHLTNEQGEFSLWLFPTQDSGAAYTVSALPPEGNGLLSTSRSGIAFTDDASVLIELSTGVTLNGRVLDAAGNGIPNQCVNLSTASGSVATDDSGFYSISVVPGNYPLKVSPCGSNDLSNAPHQYTIAITSPLSLIQNTTLDLQLPLKHLKVHVQDSDGLPVAGVAIGTDDPFISGLTISGLPATGSSRYGQTNNFTNESGEISLWLFPTQDSGAAYTVSALPPEDSIYASFTLNNVIVTGTQSIVISLQELNSSTNVTPVVNEISVSPNPVQINTSTTATATFSDPDSADTHTAVWDFGDGTAAVPGIVTEENGSGSVTGSHTYAQTGVYTITLTVTDNHDASDTSTYQFLVVYDPDGGFVTGGGWIASPEGAYPADNTLSGKAIFGFVSKYKKGANVPEGNTQFNFQIVNFNFNSTSYDWLVIAGSKAQYKGTGMINGQGSYKFILTATDASPDKFRLKVWNADTNTIMYDNQQGEADDSALNTAIGGGSIVIHK